MEKPKCDNCQGKGFELECNDPDGQKRVKCAICEGSGIDELKRLKPEVEKKIMYHGNEYCGNEFCICHNNELSNGCDMNTWTESGKCLTRKKYYDKFGHTHVNNGKDDACKKCGLDLRNEIHLREEERL